MGKITPKVIRFNFYSLTFSSRKSVKESLSSNDIMRSVMNYIENQMRNEGQGVVIDKHRNQKQANPRELFIYRIRRKPKERRILCSLAMFRSGRKPLLKPHGEFKLIPINDTNSSLVEETNFYIDFSGSNAILCVEFNNYGPRHSDIEYYFRQIADKQLKLASKTTLTLFMEDDLDDTIKNLKNVLNLHIKMSPKSIINMDKDLVGSYFTGLNNFQNFVKPKFLRIEAYYQTRGKVFNSNEINSNATSMVKKLLQRFKSAPYNKDCFQHFEVLYNDENGEPETFTLLKGKKEIVLEEIDPNTNNKQLYELIEPEFDEFLNEIRN